MCGPAERCTFVIIALLLLACDAAFAAPNFQACGDIPEDKIEVPGGQVVLQLHANGTRNYTCSLPGGPAIVGDDQGAVLAKFTYERNSTEILGFSYSNEKGHVVMVIDNPPEGLPGKAEMETEVADPLGTSPIFQPSPRNDSIPWARWRVTSDGGTGVLENVTYVTRFDTEGGEKPEHCPPGKKTAEVPFKAAYKFYTCTQSSSSSSLNASKCIPSVLFLTTLASILLMALT